MIAGGWLSACREANLHLHRSKLIRTFNGDLEMMQDAQIYKSSKELAIPLSLGEFLELEMCY